MVVVYYLLGVGLLFGGILSLGCKLLGEQFRGSAVLGVIAFEEEA
jgi:hypothetical protein